MSLSARRFRPRRRHGAPHPCDDKGRYDSARAAHAVMNKCLALRPDTPLRVYLCPFCDAWHITSKPRFGT